MSFINLIKIEIIKIRVLNQTFERSNKTKGSFSKYDIIVTDGSSEQPDVLLVWDPKVSYSLGQSLLCKNMGYEIDKKEEGIMVLITKSKSIIKPIEKNLTAEIHNTPKIDTTQLVDIETQLASMATDNARRDNEIKILQKENTTKTNDTKALKNEMKEIKEQMELLLKRVDCIEAILEQNNI